MAFNHKLFDALHPSNSTMESRMIEAHQHGMAYARELDASLRAARNKAKHTYATEPERESFVAGYIGALKRMTLG